MLRLWSGNKYLRPSRLTNPRDDLTPSFAILRNHCHPRFLSRHQAPFFPQTPLREREEAIKQETVHPSARTQ